MHGPPEPCASSKGRGAVCKCRGVLVGPPEGTVDLRFKFNLALLGLKLCMKTYGSLNCNFFFSYGFYPQTFVFLYTVLPTP